MEKKMVDVVYLEDDEILRRSWTSAASKKGLEIMTFKTGSELLEKVEEFSMEKTSIYLDSDLGEGEMKGEEVALILHNMGFKKLFLASGFERGYFEGMPSWLRLVGKRPLF